MPIDDTLVAEYSSGTTSSSDDGAIIELDDVYNTYTENGEEQVKTSFNPGDEAYFRVNLRNDLQITDWDSTNGTVTFIGTETRTLKRQVFFYENGQSEDLGYYINSIISAEYWGDIAPQYQLNDNKVIINTLDDTLSIFLLTYTATFSIFRLTPPNLDDFFPAEDPNPNELDFEDSYPIGISVNIESIA